MNNETTITEWQARLPRRSPITAQLSGIIRKPIVTAVVGALVWLAGLAIDRLHYRVPGGYSWTASRQLLACRQAAALTGRLSEHPRLPSRPAPGRGPPAAGRRAGPGRDRHRHGSPGSPPPCGRLCRDVPAPRWPAVRAAL
jgi:hypothetical protein